MSRLPTAKDMVDKWQDIALNNIKSDIQDDNSLENTLIEFAKLHVEAALKEASENAKVQMGDDCILNKIAIHPNSLVDTAVITTNAASILNSYPLDNIK